MVKMLEVRYLTMLLLISAVTAAAEDIPRQNRPMASIRYECTTKTWLSASVSTPRRNGVPETQIKLADSNSRQQGITKDGDRIPRSRYEIVAEIPQFPEKSTQHAVEICDAEPGQYMLTIYEHGNELYRVTVEAGTPDDGVAVLEKLRSQEGRVREFRFRLNIKEGHLYLTWLDGNGKPQLHAADNDW